MNYRHFDISADQFRNAHNFHGHISKIIIQDSKKMCVAFAFAVDLLSITKHNINLDELLDKAIDTVKSKIDEGLFEDLELTYEYNHPDFVKVDNPKWWIKTKY